MDTGDKGFVLWAEVRPKTKLFVPAVITRKGHSSGRLSVIILADVPHSSFEKGDATSVGVWQWRSRKPAQALECFEEASSL